MSSSTTTTAAAAAAEEEAPLTYWCHECDMSIHLTLPSASNATPLCPQCHHDFLELMDPTPSTTDTDFLHLDSPTFRATFFHHFNKHLDDHYDQSSSSSSSSSRSSSSSSYFLLPTIKIAEGEDNDSSLVPCAVCQDSFALDEEAKKLPCRHLFHPDCILPWLSSGHDSCPLCRFHLTAHNPASELEEEWFSDFEKCFGSSSSSTTATADSR